MPSPGSVSARLRSRSEADSSFRHHGGTPALPLLNRALRSPPPPIIPTVPDSIWAIGEAYEPYVGRWSRAVARDFLTWLAVPPAARWLDVGCGTGALTATILATAGPAS